MRKRVVFAAAFALAAPAHAIIYTLDWTGIVQHGAWLAVGAGDTVSGSITIDSQDTVVGATSDGPVVADLVRSCVLYIGGHRLDLAMTVWQDLDPSEGIALSDAVLTDDAVGGGFSFGLGDEGPGGWGFETRQGDTMWNPHGAIVSVSRRDAVADGNAAPVPEPSTLLLLGAGLAGTRFFRRTR